jgi:hypothetical protein
MYTGDIIWQHCDFLRLIKFLIIEILSLTNKFIMSSDNIASTLATAFVSLDSYLNTLNNTLNSTTTINESICASGSVTASPISTASSDYFAIIEEVENQTLIESACLNIQYSKDIDNCLAEHDATAVGLLINIVQAAELIEQTAKLLPNL